MLSDWSYGPIPCSCPTLILYIYKSVVNLTPEKIIDSVTQ